jgi:hypothetical protein
MVKVALDNSTARKAGFVLRDDGSFLLRRTSRDSDEVDLSGQSALVPHRQLAKEPM